MEVHHAGSLGLLGEDTKERMVAINVYAEYSVIHGSFWIVLDFFGGASKRVSTFGENDFLLCKYLDRSTS